MNTNDTRRSFILIGATSLASIAIPKLALGDPDERPTPSKRKPKDKKRRPTKKKKLTRDDREDLRDLQRDLDKCAKTASRAEYRISELKKENAKLENYAKKQHANQIDLSKAVKHSKSTDRKLKTELRRGKSPSGSKFTLKEKDDLVRKINQNNTSGAKSETDLRRSKAGVKNVRKRQNELRKETRNMQGLRDKSVGQCKSINKQIDALRAKGS